MDYGFDLPKTSIAHLPTPLEPLLSLSKYLGGPELWVKRDDQTGLATGGNKTRKLEYLLEDAKQKGAQLLITRGAAQSNHCRQTAAAAAHLGVQCKLILTGQQPEGAAGNLLLDNLFGADIAWTEGEDPERKLRSEFKLAEEQGLNPYLIPYGGSNRLGVYAYAAAMQEWIDQDGAFDRIVFASSSGGTQAGMILGAKLVGFEGTILGISVDEPAGILQKRIETLVLETAGWMQLDIELRDRDVQVDDRFIGEGYAVLSDLEREAILTFARKEGLLLDPVYTGRAAGGMMELVRNGEIPADERVLFWHTGGIPAIFVFGEALL